MRAGFQVAALVLSLVFAPAAWAQAPAPDLAAALSAARGACEAKVAAKFDGMNPTMRGAALALRDLTLSGVGDCGAVKILADAEVPALLKGLEAEIKSRRADYGCDNDPTRAECEAIAGAALRLADTRALAAGDDKQLISTPTRRRYDRSSTYAWRYDLSNSFGTDPEYGVSLLRQVLKAGPTSPAFLQKVQPGTPYGGVAIELAAPGVADDNCLASCQLAVGRIVSSYSLYMGLDTVFQKATSEAYQDSIKLTGDLVAQWDAYHFGGGQGRAQLPWELLLNSVIYERRPTATVQGTSWRKPPNGAVILLHPSVGLGLKDTKGADSSIVSVVELLGYSRWSYDAKTQARASEIGASVIAAYRKRDDARDWGYGVLVRLPVNTLNLAWVRTELDNGKSDDTFALTLDLSRFAPRMDARCLFGLPNCAK